MRRAIGYSFLFTALVMALISLYVYFDFSPATAATPNITLQTTLTDAPPVMNVYQSASLTGTEIQDIITKFDMQAAMVETDTPERMRLVGGSKHLVIFKDTGVFDYSDYSIIDTTQTISVSTDTAVQAANNFLTSRNLLDSQTVFKRGGRVEHQDDNDQMQLTEFLVRYGKNINWGGGEMPAGGPGAKMVVSIGQANEVGMVMKIMPKYESVGATQTISGSEAFERLKANPQNQLLVPVGDSQIEITTMTVAYWVPSPSEPKFIEPAYIFQGTVSDSIATDAFVQVIPAISKTNIDELKPSLPVKGSIGGIVYAEDGGASAVFENGSFSGKLEMTIEETASPQFNPPDGLVMYSKVYDFIPDIAFSGTATVEFLIDKNFDPNSGDIYHWNGAGWDKVTQGKTVDANLSKISATVNSFSPFVVLGPPPPPTGVNLKFYFVVGILLLITGILLAIIKAPMKLIMVFAVAVTLFALLTVPLLADDSLNEIFVSGLNEYSFWHGCGDWTDLKYAISDVKTFEEDLKKAGLSSKRKLGDDANPEQWEGFSKGKDQDYVETADLAYFHGHGYPLKFRFNTYYTGSGGNDCYVGKQYVGWGNEAGNDLEVVALASCNVLKNEFMDDAKDRWKAAFKGLHTMVGFATYAWDDDNQGSFFADYLDGFSDKLTVWEAWKKASEFTQNEDIPWYYGGGSVKAAIIYVKKPDSANSLKDKLVGFGSQAADSASPQSLGYGTYEL